MSVENLPGLKAAAYFKADSAAVFREDPLLCPIAVSDTLSFMPWGVDNQMPYNILDLIEKDETLSTCQLFNAEVCFGAGLSYVCDDERVPQSTRNRIEDFCTANDLAAYFLGVCQDFKHFGFAVSVIILNKEGTRIVRLLRKEACYCRFSPAEKDGRITKVLYANWRNQIPTLDDMEVIELLDPHCPTLDLEHRMKRKTSVRKFAVVSRVPTVDSTYYPIPHYAALFRGKWYNIKQYIGVAKEAKLKNTAPIKYHIGVYYNIIIR